MHSKGFQHILAQFGNCLSTLADCDTWPGFATGLTENEFDDVKQIIRNQHQYNGWFTEENIYRALKAWGMALNEKDLAQWLSSYTLTASSQKTVAIICAGNIPAVGLHDVLSVLAAGHKALIKLSADDKLLIPALMQILIKLEPALAQCIAYTDGKLTDFDAVIATGRNNSSRYFRYYFSQYPHIIRKSRTSAAVITGTETDEEMLGLGHDIFDYFGLGCRNVSHLFLPEGYNLDHLFKGIFPFAHVANHNKYANNYDYNKAVWLLNREDLLDNGFVLLKEDNNMTSPTASIYYSRYQNSEHLAQRLKENDDVLQCVAGRGYIPFGKAQQPKLTDYADGVDTMQFLTGL
ncbi:MAG: acyl-CoA reductase [Flavobacteriales bacterium]